MCSQSPWSARPGICCLGSFYAKAVKTLIQQNVFCGDIDHFADFLVYRICISAGKSVSDIYEFDSDSLCGGDIMDRQ